jgi:adenine-specific DNA-methyltransferase
MTDARQKLQALLRELFQFDCSDLDFGIYRIMNHKRVEIERFVEKDLLDAVAREIDQGVLSSQAQAASQLAEAALEVRSSLGAEAISPEGQLSEHYRATPLGQRYLELREQAATYQARPEQETLVFNHLFEFFRRYYQDGDFISKRRYSRRERYAIPYNGEEVYLHWANRDQYYVKTGEYFTDYTFKAPGGVTVHFKLQAADVEQNNVKGEKRFFIPLTAKATWEESSREVVIPFEYRPLTDQENITYGTRDQQEKIIREALEKVPARLRKHVEAVAALMAERRRNAHGEPVSYLEHHLRQYTRRNTSDFFIHKNLRGFLERELDFYLKNEVLNLEEVLAGDDGRAEGWFQLMQVIRRIALCIIAFLAQIEDFQKRLWEKKKFVLSTDYCVTLDRVPEDLYPEIAANQAQIEEWRRLFRIDEIAPTLFHSGGKAKKAKGKGKKTRLDVAFLKAHPTLVLDTRFFAQHFKDRLLAAFDNLEEQTGGLLVHGDNYHALSLLLQKYRNRVNCVYIDPPYNSKTTAILYKNDYRHSSWLSLMDSRLFLSSRLTTTDGSHIIAIDENEQEVLGRLLALHFPDYERVCVAIVHNKKGIQGDYFSYSHDYAYFCIPRALPETNGRPVPKAEWEYVNLRKWGRESERETARNCFYPIYIEGDDIVGFGDVCDESFHPGRPNVPCDKAGRRVAVYPVDAQGVERKWRYARQSVESVQHLLRVHRTSSGEIQIHKAQSERQFKTVWDDPTYIAGDYGTKWLTDLGLKVAEDLYPKSVHTVADSIHAVYGPDALVVDYFAGSGTTGHAVIRLNQADGGRRKFVLVEIGDYFETVLLPRMKKVTFAPEWREGKPARAPTKEEADRSPRVMKYHRLESYEDTLNNIAFDDAAGQKALDLYGNDYLLRYMLDFETRESETLLSVARLESPFSYTLLVHRDGETREQPVDLPETFNYLIGLHVKTRRVYHDGERRYLVYRGSNERSEVVVIWRETTGWTEADLERDKQFVLEKKLTEGADGIFVNGDSFVPGAKALDPVFKRLMLGGTD